MAVQPGEKED